MSQVRVRIAPSPTGPPHVGTAYIALFNLVFARANGGKFVLRVEDTDQTRSRQQYEDDILKAMKWLGLTWDEGPDVGGDYGPYRQSERTKLYQQYAEKLIVKNGAYRCFCTPERLQKMREDQLKRNATTKYDGKCRHLSENAVGMKLKNKEPYTIRLKVPRSGKCVVHDRLRGKIVYKCKEIDDQILLKSDGYPTYHLANIVDDHLMEISHVIRGEEWLTSTPKHVLLYDSLGWEKPEFIHMPLLLNPDKSKLSKRKNPTSVFYYQDAGYLPQAMLNFMGLMSYSRPNGEEKFTIEEMCEDFDIDRVSLGGSIFDLGKLRWLSGRYLREDHSPETLYRLLKEWRFNDEFTSKIMPLMQKRMDTLGDFLPLCSFFWAREVTYPPEQLIPKKREAQDVAQMLQLFLFALDGEMPWTAEKIGGKIEEVATLLEWKIREVTQPLFVAVSGNKVAPPLFESMELLGRDLSRVRILNAIEALGGVSKKKLQRLEKLWRNRDMESPSPS